MTVATKHAAAKSKTTKPSTPAGATATGPEPAPDRKPILGVDIRGELVDVDLAKVIDLAGASDRMARPGDEAAIAQLARSMRECGQLQPVMLERLADGRFCRVFGRRRIAAARTLGWTTIRASVVPPLADDVRRTVVAIENVQRQDLTPAEETLAVDELMRLQAVPAAVQLARPIGPACPSWTGKVITPEVAQKILSGRPDSREANAHDLLLDHHVRAIATEMVAAMLGKPAVWVRDRLYIGRLSEKARRLVLEGKLPLAHAREIAKVADEKRRQELCEDYAAGGGESISDVEAGPLEDLQSEVRRSVFALHVVPWKLGEAFAGRPPCEGCPHNSTTNPGLFEGGGKVSVGMVGGRGTYDCTSADGEKVTAAGVCTLPSCYADKLRAAKAAISAAAKRIADAPKGGGGGGGAPSRVPAFVATAALEKKVKERRSSNASGRTGQAREKPKTPAQIAAEKKQAEREAAEEKLMAASERHAKALQEAVDKVLKQDPIKDIMLAIIQQDRMYQRATQWGDGARKVAQSPGFAKIFDPLRKPITLDGLKAAAKAVRLSEFDTWHGARSGASVVVARALGVEIGKVPVLEDYLPGSGK